MKLIKFCLLCILAPISTLYAATYTSRPPLFIDIEGGYTWTSFGTFTNLGLSYPRKDRGGTGRIAGGAIHYVKNTSHAFTAEAGYGYYGNTSYDGSPQNSQLYLTQTGLDILLGVMANYQDFSFWLKLGGMVQSIKDNDRDDLSQTIGGNATSGIVTTKEAYTVWLPELKVMGTYAIYDNLDISLSYLNVFGPQTASHNSDQTTNANTALNNKTTVFAGLSFYTVLAGLHYKFG